MNVQERLKEFLTDSVRAELDPALLGKVESLFAASRPRDEVSDAIVAEVTKYLESELRQLTEQFRGEVLAGKARNGVELLSKMKQARLFILEPQPEPLVALADYLVSERNGPHHGYLDYEWPRFLGIFLGSSVLLKEIRLRTLTWSVPVEMTVAVFPLKCQAGAPLSVTAEIRTRDSGVPVTVGVSTAMLRFSDGSSRQTVLTFSAIDMKWVGVLGTGSAPLGGFRLEVQSKSEAGNFVSRKPVQGEII